MSAWGSVEERFWMRVWQGDGCWLWTGARTNGGYGTLRVDGATARVHRFAYAFLVGPIPEGAEVDHLCHGQDESCPGGRDCSHRLCVNPDHLEPVSHRENVVRGLNFSGVNARKTHCPQGHPYDAENTYVCGGGRHRMCRACLADREAARKARGWSRIRVSPETGGGDE